MPALALADIPFTSILSAVRVGRINGRFVVNPLLSHLEDSDMDVTVAGTDDNILLKPPRKMELEAALEYIEDDELVEITPTQIRLRKMLLKEHDRRRADRKEASFST